VSQLEGDEHAQTAAEARALLHEFQAIKALYLADRDRLEKQHDDLGRPSGQRACLRTVPLPSRPLPVDF